MNFYVFRFVCGMVGCMSSSSWQSYCFMILRKGFIVVFCSSGIKGKQHDDYYYELEDDVSDDDGFNKYEGWGNRLRSM